MKKLITIFSLITLFSLITDHWALSQGIWKTYTRADGLAGDTVYCINQDKFGNMWFGHWAAGLSKLDTNGVWTNYWNSTDSLVFIDDIEFDSLNNIWLSYDQLYGKTRYGEHIVKFNDSTIIYYNVIAGMASPICLGKDSLGQIWCGMSDYGLACWFDGSEWQLFRVPGTGIYSEVNEIKTDRLGKLYFAHDWGLSTLTNVVIYLHSPVWDMEIDKQNRIWLATNRDLWGLMMLDGKNFHAYTTEQGLLSNYLNRGMAVDSNNNVWITYSGDFGVSKFDGSTFTHFDRNDGLASNRVYDIFVDRDGNIWFATRRGVSVLHDTVTTRVASLSEFSKNKILSMFHNYPNPFNKATKIRYTLKERSQIELKVFNLLGEEVTTLFTGQQQAGDYELYWDGTNQRGKEVNSGIYIAVLKANEMKKAIKLSLIK